MPCRLRPLAINPFCSCDAHESSAQVARHSDTLPGVRRAAFDHRDCGLPCAVHGASPTHPDRGRHRLARRAPVPSTRPTPSAWSTPQTLRHGGPMVNLSEALNRVPGLIVANREQLCAGPADQLARLRRALDLRRARPAPVHRRHPRHHARRPGPGLALRPRRRGAHRGAARPVLGAVRQQLGRRDRAVQRRRRASATASRPRSTSAATACARCALGVAAPLADGWDVCAPGQRASRPTASGRTARPSARSATCGWAGSASATA